MIETISDKLLSILFLVGGISTLVYYFIERNKSEKSLIETGENTEGIITKLEKSISSNNNFENDNLNIMDEVTISFITKNGDSITTQLKQKLAVFYTGQYKIGEKIELFYNKNNPKDIYVITKQSETNGSILIISVSIIIIIIGIFLFFN